MLNCRKITIGLRRGSVVTSNQSLLVPTLLRRDVSWRVELQENDHWVTTRERRNQQHDLLVPTWECSNQQHDLLVPTLLRRDVVWSVELQGNDHWVTTRERRNQQYDLLVPTLLRRDVVKVVD